MSARADDLLVVSDLHRHFAARAGQVVRAVDGVSFTVRAGEVFGLVGESGCGKSTLGRTAVGLYRPSSGEVRLLGRSVHGLAPAVRSRQVQILFQDPYSSLDPRMTVEAIVTEGLHVPRRERARRAAAILESVGLSAAHAGRFPHEFSGGQRQRIGLARALAVEPRLLVADEPLSALDVSIQAQMVNLMQRLRRERGLTYLFIAHDLAMVRYFSDRIGVMYLGRFAESGPADAIFDHPLHPYTRALLASASIPDPARERARPPVQVRGEVGQTPPRATGCPFAPRCPYAQDRCLVDTPPLRELAPGQHVACHFAEVLPDPRPFAV